jgi:hypothetical protein
MDYLDSIHNDDSFITTDNQLLPVVATSVPMVANQTSLELLATFASGYVLAKSMATCMRNSIQ